MTTLLSASSAGKTGLAASCSLDERDARDNLAYLMK
jgi:hypothetical protein